MSTSACLCACQKSVSRSESTLPLSKKECLSNSPGSNWSKGIAEKGQPGWIYYWTIYSVHYVGIHLCVYICYFKSFFFIPSFTPVLSVTSYFLCMNDVWKSKFIGVSVIILVSAENLRERVTEFCNSIYHIWRWWTICTVKHEKITINSNIVCNKMHAIFFFRSFSILLSLVMIHLGE